MAGSKKIGRYELLRTVASGGMAELFLAKFTGPEGFEKHCAVKRILPQFSGDTEFVRMFLNEARLAARLQHPNIIQIFDLGEDEARGEYFIAMEFVDGLDLSRLHKRSQETRTRMPPELSAYMISQALDGLHYAHSFTTTDGKTMGVVHRDVSPQNILISYDGVVKLVDFGVAKARSNEGKTQHGVIKGKVAYMSPEQAGGEELDGRSDVFAAGICLYELLTGQLPFFGPTDYLTLKKVIEDPPPPLLELAPDCPPGIARAVERSLQKKRDDRFQSARDFARELQAELRRTPSPIDRDVLSKFVLALVEYDTETFSDNDFKIPKDQVGTDLVTTQTDLPPEPNTEINTSPVVSPLASGLHEATVDDDEIDRRAIVAKGPWIALAAAVAAAMFAVVIVTADSEPEVVDTPAVEPPQKVAPAEPEPPVADEPPIDADDDKEEPTPEPKRRRIQKRRAQRHNKPVAPEPKEEPKPPPTSPTPSKTSVEVLEPSEEERAEPRQTPGKIVITTKPEGLKVRLGSRLLGVTPMAEAKLPPGRWILNLSHPYLGISKTISVDIESGAELRREIVIGKGKLQIEAREPARVYINGKPMGSTPIEVELYEGRHRVRLEARSGATKNETVTLEADATQKIEF